MSRRADVIPVVLVAYARPDHLRRVLACLRSERVPLILAYADGSKGNTDAAAVAEVRAQLRAIDWTEVRVKERALNVGLGKNVLAAVGEVAAAYEAFIVWEDDLVCVPGTYSWLEAALRRHVHEPRVLSVTAWTHAMVRPAAVDGPYFDARAECWVWGSYARAWPGMERTALEKLAAVEKAGMRGDAYGADLPVMARAEARRNTWAVRWIFHHFEQRGLCLRPPWSMVEHIGVDPLATNAAQADRWANPPLRLAPPIPREWPAPVEHPECRTRWQRAAPAESIAARLRAKLGAVGRDGWGRARALVRAAAPVSLRAWVRRRRAWQWFRGDYATWSEARAASGGYEDGAIVDRVLAATLHVQAGRAAFERDGVLFHEPDPDAPLLAAIKEICRRTTGPLRVLDFGGSLGSAYWRLRAHLPSDAIARWDVVEQAGFVAAGEEHVREERLKFFSDVRAATLKAGGHDVLLASGVIQYLKDPAGMLAEWRALRIPWLLLNNVPLHAEGPTRLRVQHVPPEIYRASYPVRFFNRSEFLAWLGDEHQVIREFAAEAVWPVDGGMYPSTGLLLRRREG